MSDHSVTEALRAWRVQHSAGISVVDALEMCAPICSERVHRACFSQAAALAQKGEDIERMLAALAPLISEADRAAIAAGWNSGRVEAALDGVILQRELWEQAAAKVKAKMMLPLLILLLAAFVAPLPRLIQTGDVVAYLFSAMLPLVAAAIVWKLGGVAVQRARERKTAGQSASAFDRTLLQLPLIGGIERNRNLAEFSSALSNMLTAGVPITVALETTARTVSNGVYRNEIAQCLPVVRGGNPLSAALRRCELWPLEFISIVEVGEKSGALDQTLSRAANHARESYIRSIETFAEWLPRILYGLVALFIIFNIVMLASQIGGAYQGILR